MGMARGVNIAYLCGLEIAVPTGPEELGWAMRVGGP